MAKKQNPIWGWHKKVLEQNSLVLTVGVLAIQGGFAEHMQALERQSGVTAIAPSHPVVSSWYAARNSSQSGANL